MATITSRELNRDVSAAKRAASEGPVTITDHGRPTHVLMTAEEYSRITGSKEKFGRRLLMPGYEDIDLDLPDRSGFAQREIEL
jgi:prevent-host-death family protein